MPDLVINLTSPPVIRETITQNAHGFVVGDVLRCDNTVANTYAKALADTEDNAKAVGVVNQVVNANEFVLTFAGRILSGVPAQAQGSVMYLSDSVAGTMTTTPPTIAVRIMEISENAVSGIVNIDWKGGTGGGSVNSVTGDSVDNTDPANPVVNAVPLAGTALGSPVTGDIEIDNSIEQFIYQENGAERNEFRSDLPNKTIEFSYRNADVTSIFTAGAVSSRIGYEDTSLPGSGDYIIRASLFSDSATYPVVTIINGLRCDFNGQSAPGVNDDDTLGFGVTSFRIYNGVIYICTDSTTGAAVWSSPSASPAIVSLTRAALQALISGSALDTTITYRVTNAVGSTIVVDTWAATSNTLQSAMIDQTNTKFGFYNITGDTFIEVYIPAIASPAQGDIIYRNGSGAWTRLAAGTSINNLRTGGSGANPLWDLPIPCVDAGGTADAITATYSPAATLQDNLIVAVVAASANTTSNPTFAPNGLTAYTIVKGSGQALEYGDIPGSEAVILLRYDSANTRWVLLNPAKGALRGTIRISGNVTTTSDTASDITGFTLPVEANSEYCIELNLRIGCNNTGGVKMGWNLPASATLEGPLIGSTTGVTAQSMFSVLVSAQTLGTTQYNTTNSATGAIVQRLILVTGANSGTLAFQFASGTSGQTSTIYGTGSYMRWEKVQ